MATIKDVAREAGVSVATVSYYINQKPVSEDKARRIADAIQKLNYVVQTSARELRVQKNRVIGILFPNLSDPYYVKILESIKLQLTRHNRPYRLLFSDNDPEYERQILENLVGSGCSGIILYSCQPILQDAVSMLQHSHIPFVLVDRYPEKCTCNSVSCDNYQLFYDLVMTMCGENPAPPTLLCGPLSYTENRDARRGFLDAAAACHQEKATVIEAGALSREEGFHTGMQLYAEENRPCKVLTTSSLLAEGFLYAARLNHLDPARDFLLVTAGDCEEDVFYSNPLIRKTSRASFRMGEACVALLLESIRMGGEADCQHRVIPNPPTTLFPPEETSPRTAVGNSKSVIRLLLPDYTPDHPLHQLISDFYAKEGIHVEFCGIEAENMYDEIEQAGRQKRNDYDVFLFDAPYLTDFVSRGYLLSLDSYIQTYHVDTNQYLPSVIDLSCQSGGHYYALPYLASTQFLFYRRDFFTNPHAMRQFEKQYQIPLAPPDNWEKFNQIAGFFTRSCNPCSPALYGNAFDFSYSSLIVCAFWNRLFASQNRAGNTFPKRGYLTSAASVRALKNLLDCVSFTHPQVYQQPGQALNRLIDGEAAMTVSFYNLASDLRQPSLLEKIGYAPIPEKASVLAGWALGINPYSSHAEEAFRFIKWAASSSIAIPLALLDGQSACQKSYDNYDVLSLYPWLSNAPTALEQAKSRHFTGTYHGRYSSDRLVEKLLADEITRLLDETTKGQLPGEEEILQALTLVDHKAFK